MNVRVQMNPANMIIKGLKLDEQGTAFHTNNVMRRMQRYMGFRTGTMVKLMVAGTNIKTGLIRVPVPYARTQYYGISRKGKHINYNTRGHTLAGPKWNDRMMSAEGDKVRSELSNYLKARVVK